MGYTTLTNEEIETLKAKVLELSTMLMEIFDNVLENIDEDYTFSLSPTLILALLVSMGICVIALGIVFIWYRRKTYLTSSTVGNLVKLVPSLNERVPTLNSLMPILSELTSSKNNENVITPAAVSKLSQTPLDELILPPILVPQLQVATKPSSTIDEPLHLEPTPKLSAEDVKSEPVSLEMFNRAATDLNTKGIINLKKYNQYLVKKSSKPV